MTGGSASGGNHAGVRARVRLRAWLNDVQMSNRIGSPHYANPGELKADLRTLLAELDTLTHALEIIAAHPIVAESRLVDDVCDWHCTITLTATAKDALADIDSSTVDSASEGPA